MSDAESWSLCASMRSVTHNPSSGSRKPQKGQGYTRSDLQGPARERAVRRHRCSYVCRCLNLREHCLLLNLSLLYCTCSAIPKPPPPPQQHAAAGPQLAKSPSTPCSLFAAPALLSCSPPASRPPRCAPSLPRPVRSHFTFTHPAHVASVPPRLPNIIQCSSAKRALLGSASPPRAFPLGIVAGHALGGVAPSWVPLAMTMRLAAAQSCILDPDIMCCGLLGHPLAPILLCGELCLSM